MHDNQWTRPEYLEINTQSSSHEIFDRSVEKIHSLKESLHNKCCWRNQTVISRRMKLDLYFPLWTKISSKVTKVFMQLLKP